MDHSHKNYIIKRGELLFLFILFIIGGALIFAVGIRMGKDILQNDCQNILEENQKKINELESKTIEEKDVNTDDATTPQDQPQEINTTAKPSTELGIKEVSKSIKNKYTIQISSHQDEEEAKREAGELYEQGYKLAYYMEAEVPGKGTWYRVGMGFFDKKSGAEMFAEMLKKQGKITSYIIKKID